MATPIYSLASSLIRLLSASSARSSPKRAARTHGRHSDQMWVQIGYVGVSMNELSIQSDGEQTRRDQQARETRTKLIETALHLFAEKGVDNTSIKDIAREAGVAQGLLYHYFAGKDDLLWRVLETDTFLPHLQQALSAEDTRAAEDVLRSVALQFNAFLHARQSRMRLIMGELQTNPRVRELWEESIRRESALLEDFLRARVSAGELRPHRVEVMAYMLMHGVVTLYLPGGSVAVSNEAAINEMVAILVRGVQAKKTSSGA